MTNNEVNNLCRLIDNNASAFCGILLKRIEILNNQGLDLPKFHKIFKAEVRELLYENSRNLKNIIKFADDTIKFVRPKPE